LQNILFSASIHHKAINLSAIMLIRLFGATQKTAETRRIFTKKMLPCLLEASKKTFNWNKIALSDVFANANRACFMTRTFGPRQEAAKHDNLKIS
jgi:hypothetical protein